MKHKASLITLLKVASLLLIPLALIALLATMYTMRQSRDDSYERQNSIMQYQIKHLDNGFNQVNYYMASALSTDENVRKLQTTNRRNILAPYWVNESLNQFTSLQNLVNTGYSFYISVPKLGLSSCNRTTQENYDENCAVENFLSENLNSFPSVGISTIFCQIGGKIYCLSLGQSRGVYLAGWIRLDNLFSFMDSVIQSEDGFYLLVDRDFQPIEQQSLFRETGVTLKDDGTVSVGRKDAVATLHWSAMGIGIITIDGRVATLGDAGMYLITVLLLCALTAGCSLYFILYFRRNIQRPLQALQQNVSQYINERKFTRRYGFAELNDVANAFSELETQVNGLKIDIYEEKLRRTRTELEFLQNQIKPHFFVNCFNIIIGMAEWEKFDQIQDFCMLLSSYVRYTLCDGFETVTLKEELQQTTDFLAIQDIRFDSQTTLRDFEDEELLDCQVPPLMLLTLAENSVKHNKFKVESLQLTVTVQHIPGGLNGLLRIDYQDNGVGIGIEESRKMTQMLENVRAGVLGKDETVSFSNQQIGLQNVYRRLLLLYGERAKIELMPVDRTEGFKIRITMPLTRKKEAENPQLPAS